MNRLPVFIASATMMCADVLAQAPTQDMSVDDLVKVLTPQRTTTRSLRNLKVEPAKVDLVINFDFDSARIRDSSTPLLDRLANAMKNERLQSMRFQVEGHTDRKGSADYNQALSEKRARAVVAFLSRDGVELVRLIPIGRGFSELLNKDDPNAAENRRVRIITIDH